MSQLVPKWVAWLHNPYNHHEKKVRTAKVHVLETEKQFRLAYGTPTEKEAQAACGYRSRVNKSENDCLFDTEMEALQNLLSGFEQRERQATERAFEAQENLFLAGRAMEDAKSRV